MKIKIIGVGKLKEKYLKDGINEYVKRLTHFTKIEIIEVADEAAKENLSLAQKEQVKECEGKRILAKIKENEYVIALEITAKQVSSEELAQNISERLFLGDSNLTFIIGGSLGLAQNILKRANKKISFGKITFPHQLMRLILIEQIYRSFMINSSYPYHK